MPHLVEELQHEAISAIDRMKQAAIVARHVHARAELMRHMLTTARKVKDKPKTEAVETVVREWMDAWNLDRDAWPHVAREMTLFTQAFHDYANAPSEAHDAALRLACDALDEVLSREGTSISQQMAFRSQCAHRWWELVEPTPVDLPGGKPRPSMPKLETSKPFWASGCAAFCR